MLRIDRELKLSAQKDSMEKLMAWCKSLSCRMLLILDNCDEHFHVEKDALQDLIVKLLKNSKHLKVLTTSRRQVAYIDAHKLFPITELSISHACELLRGNVKYLGDAHCADIARLTGSVPLALHVVGALLDMPNPPSPQQIINQLNESPIRTLSPEELRTSDTVNASIFLSYQYLDTVAQKSGRYLSHFPGSFSKDAGCAIIRNFSSAISPCQTPNLLVKRSLLKISPELGEELGIYEYHMLIRQFFKEMSNPKELERFNINYIRHYTSELANGRLYISDLYLLKENSISLLLFSRSRHNIQHFFNLLGDKATFQKNS